jgi:hypothetical protein
MKFRVLWDVVPCSHVEVDRRFKGAIIRAMICIANKILLCVTKPEQLTLNRRHLSAAY